ncbi:hypothetical protein [Mesorhizobium sp. M0047]|uniref:hypothetical protein n=1 Tax=Mesorhizobium sp. M0047 TaxID=2956859 RepID=UPI00333AFDB4
MGDFDKRSSETSDFVVTYVLRHLEYSDSGVAVSLIDTQGSRIRLHLTTVTAEMLCERIADALESRYGKS